MRLLRSFLLPALTLVLVAAALVACVATADAFSLRSPQVPFNNGVLSAYFSGKGQVINPMTDQLDAQVWSTTLSGNSTFSFMLERSVVDNLNSIGLYNTNDVNPALYQVFPGAATVGWHALAHFQAGNLIVTLFDNMGAFQGQTTYLNVDPNYFGFYLQRQGVLYFSHDWRNPGGKPQVLTYAGIGTVNSGTWWECFEDFPYNPQLSSFVGAVLSLESVNPVPAAGTTWGRLKSLYK
jgi:hypothetical protein